MLLATPFAAFSRHLSQSPALFSQTKAPAAILPDAFAGWERSGAAQLGTDPRKIDSASSSVLKEDRFTDFEIATYRHDDRTITVKAARFEDAAGAYAAFTFYRQPLMRAEDIGVLAASLNERVLFFSGNILVDVQFDHVTGMSGAQLRELAAHSAAGQGTESPILPTLPTSSAAQAAGGRDRALPVWPGRILRAQHQSQS